MNHTYKLRAGFPATAQRPKAPRALLAPRPAHAATGRIPLWAPAAITMPEHSTHKNDDHPEMFW